MLTIPAANTNLPTIVVAERIASLLSALGPPVDDAMATIPTGELERPKSGSTTGFAAAVRAVVFGVAAFAVSRIRSSSSCAGMPCLDFSATHSFASAAGASLSSPWFRSLSS